MFLRPNLGFRCCQDKLSALWPVWGGNNKRRQTSRGHPVSFFRKFCNAWVYKNQISRALRLIFYHRNGPPGHHKNPQLLIYLRCGNSHAVFLGLESLLHVGYNSLNLWAFYRLRRHLTRNFPQCWMAFFNNFSHFLIIAEATKYLKIFRSFPSTYKILSGSTETLKCGGRPRSFSKSAGSTHRSRPIFMRACIVYLPRPWGTK